MRMTTTDEDGPVPPVAALALRAAFGHLAGWRAASRAAREAGGDGWLAFDPAQGRLVVPVAGHVDGDAQAPVPLAPPAAAPDTLPGAPEDGLDAAGWQAWLERYRQAVARASDGLAAPVESAAGGLVIDVRRAGARAASGIAAAGAAWMDPGSIDHWAAELPAGACVLTLCAHGHEVSQAAALRLRALGFDARFVEGGLDAWRSAGMPLRRLAADDAG